MGTKVIHPQTARDLFVHESIEVAARNDQMIFIAHPLVYAHLQEVFWPSLPGGGKGARDGHAGGNVDLSHGLNHAWTGVFNLIALPLLPFSFLGM